MLRFLVGCLLVEAIIGGGLGVAWWAMELRTSNYWFHQAKANEAEWNACETRVTRRPRRAWPTIDATPADHAQKLGRSSLPAR